MSAPLLRLVALAVLLPLLLWAKERWTSEADLHRRERRCRGFALLAGTVVALYNADVLRRVATNLRAPDEWDFMAYWLWGRAAARGLDVYDAAALSPIASLFAHSEEFQSEIVEAGSNYPPQVRAAPCCAQLYC